VKRTLPWAALALAPLVVLLAAANLSGVEEFMGKYSEGSSIGEFLVEYWWAGVVLSVGAHAVCYAVAALGNRALPLWRRVLWSVAMVLFIPLVVPIYWWVHSEPSSARDA
jgi:hypothetical protein